MEKDPLVESILSGKVPDTSMRTVQRRFLSATGITHTAIHQIERARHATILLKNGVSILDQSMNWVITTNRI